MAELSGAETYLLDSAESLGRHLGLRVVGSLMKPVTPEKLRPLFEKDPTAGDAP